MKFERCSESKNFLNDVLEVLLENEAVNIAVIRGLISDDKTSRNAFEELLADENEDERNELLSKMDMIFWSHPKRLFVTVKDSYGSVLLTAYCNHPYKRLNLYATRNKVNENAVKLFVDKLKNLDFDLPRIRAEQNLVKCFKEVYGGEFIKHSSMLAMKTDRIAEVPHVSGYCRPMEERDLVFAPFWQAECLKECNQDTEELGELYRYLKFTMNDNSAFLWEDKYPVSQAVIVCKIDNCSQIGDVYTPPYHRKKGYATSLVSALTYTILAEHGQRLSVLLADADNPTSCAIYRKIGYEEVSVIDEVSLS